MTRYIDVHDLSQLVIRKGLATCLSEMAEYIRQDYLRWDDFEKCARLANHSADGVIELMPASDASLYAFKYVNGHPKEYPGRNAHGDGIRCLGRCGYRQAGAVE